MELTSNIAPSLAAFQSSIIAETPFQAVADIIPLSDAKAIYASEASTGKHALTFSELKEFVTSMDLARFGLTREKVICTSMPNGPEAAVCFWALAGRCVFAPLNPNLTMAEVQFELTDLPAAAMITLAGDAKATMVKGCCAQAGVTVIELTPSRTTVGLFTLSGAEVPTPPTAEPTRPSDLALVLHTSGTTKKPKIVPLTHHNLGYGIQFVARTLRRTSAHTCLNVMPLFHIHGLIANVGASLYSESAVVCSSFQGGADFLRKCRAPERDSYPRPTWYSAVPTMHEAILLEAEKEKADGTLEHSLTLMRNCSAALLPPVAKRFLAAFAPGAPGLFTVVPTYAMTESFPICSNPPHLEVKLSTVGPAMGPSIKILKGYPEDVVVDVGTEGEVCVAGECVTAGYLMREHMSQDPNIEAFSLCGSQPGRMLRTGDKGYLDRDGYLQLVGRFKEIINCGGEKISPLELEDQLLDVPGVQTCVCFASPAELLGEVVGVACVVKPGYEPPTLDALRQGISTVGSRFKPAVLVYLDAIPKGPTGKPKRIGLAKHLGLPSLAGGVAVYSVKGTGDKLELPMLHTRTFLGTPVVVPTWTYPLTIRLDMNPDLISSPDRSTHVLEIDDAGCNGLRLTVTYYDHEAPWPISSAQAKEAIADVLMKTAERGMLWEAAMATGKQVAEDFCADLFVADKSKELKHSWKPGCHDSPPGKLMRLLGVLDLHDQRDAAEAVDAAQPHAHSQERSSSSQRGAHPYVKAVRTPEDFISRNRPII